MIKEEKFFNAKNIAKLGVFIAILLLINITHLGYFTIGVISVTSMHIPVIIGALYGGWKYGSILGLAFGLTSCFRALRGEAGLMSPFLANPVVSVLTRTLFGLFVGWLGDRLRGKNKVVHFAIPAFVGTLLHTTMVMGSIYFIYAHDLMQITGKSLQAVQVMIVTVFATNGLPEAIFAAILAIIICGALDAGRKNKE